MRRPSSDSTYKGDQKWPLFKEAKSHRALRQRPYHVERTASRPISEVKQRWVWLVLGWVTAWEHQMLLAFHYFSLHLFIDYFIFTLKSYHERKQVVR